MKNLSLLTFSVGVGALLVSYTSQAGVENSPHDFSRESWNVSPADPGSVCGPCHQAHHADSSVIPLWGHASSQQTFRMYNTVNVPVSQMKAVPSATPTGPSLACLSCHDGVTSINALAGGKFLGTGDSGPIVNTNAVIGTDLTHSHPISFPYTQSLVGTGPSQDQWLYNPDTTDIRQPNGGIFVPGNSLTINDFLMGGNNRVECSTCHDVHNQEGTPFDLTTNPKLLKINGVDGNNRGSLLCRSCHIK